MAVELKYNNPLTLEAGTGITGSVNGENFTTRRIEGLVDENVVINIGQAVETTSNTTFNDVTSSNVVKVGDDIEIMILEIDNIKRRISLGLKQCSDNPWKKFAAENKKGDIHLDQLYL